MTIQNGDILRVTINGTLSDGTKVQNRKTFMADISVPLADSIILIAIDTWVETLYGYVASYIPTSTDLEQGTVDLIEWNAVDSIWEVVRNVGVYSPLDTFSAADEGLPNQVAPFVVGGTLRPKTRGRLFVFPFSEASQAYGILVTAALTALGNLATQYILDQAVDAAGYLRSGVVRENVDAWYEFQSVEASDVLGTQRRRRKGVGT